MKAIIMAGGLGARLRPVNSGMPKPMVRLLGRPLLEHIVLLLARHGFSDICITLCRQPEAIRGYFGNGSAFGVNITYRTEERPLGTAGGVRGCADFTGGSDVLVISGDAVCDFDLGALMSHHRRSGAAATMALAERDEPLRYGLVMPGPGGEVIGFVEKPDWPRVVTDLVNTGIYVLSPRCIGMIPDGVAHDFACDLFPAMLRAGIPIATAVPEGYWCDVGTPEEYLRCTMDALDGRVRLESGGSLLAPGITFSGRIPERARLRAPCFVSPNAVIGPGAVIGPHACVHAGSVIGPGARIERSVVDGGTVGEGAAVREGIVCRGASLAPGVSLNGGICAPPGAEQAPDRPPLSPRQSARGVILQEIPCVSRARLMRRFSEALMEAGADFSDGLTLERDGGRIRLSPAADSSAVVIESLSGTAADRALAERCARLADSGAAGRPAGMQSAT